MSAKVMGQVFDIRLPRSQKSILLALADHADHEGKNAYPGVELLAYKTGFSERQVQRSLSALLLSGLISVTENSAGGRGKIPRYCLHLEKGDTLTPFNKWRHARAVKGDTLTPNSNIKGDTETPIESLKGDIYDTERVTFTTLKGDIYDIAYKDAGASESEPSIEPSYEPNTDPLPPAGEIGDGCKKNELQPNELQPEDLPESEDAEPEVGKPRPPARAAYKPAAFDKVYAAFPVHEAKAAAIRRWDAVKPADEEINEILLFVDAAKKTDRWKRGYIPRLAPFLNERRWEDDLSGYAERPGGSRNDNSRNGNSRNGSGAAGHADDKTRSGWDKVIAAEQAKQLAGEQRNHEPP